MQTPPLARSNSLWAPNYGVLLGVLILPILVAPSATEAELALGVEASSMGS